MEAWESKWVDYYAVLGLLPTADDEAIAAVYRRLARKYHPDSGTNRDSAKMTSINVANGVLGDKAKRAAYDREYRRRNSASSTTSGPSAGSTRPSSGPSAGSPPPRSSYTPPPPPPKVFRPILAVDEDEHFLAAEEGERVEFSFTIRLVGGELPPKWRLRVRKNGTFLDAANVRAMPTNNLPTRLSVIIPYAEPGEFEGNLEVDIEELAV